MGKEKKRFAAIALITALAITMLTGLQAGCRDLRLSADAFFDAQKLHDIYIQSTLGLTEEDIEALNALEDVEAAAGFYSESVHLQVDGSSRTAEVGPRRSGRSPIPAWTRHIFWKAGCRKSRGRSRSQSSI